VSVTGPHGVTAGLGGVRQRLADGATDDSFPILRDLREQGATDYVAMPLPFSDGRVNVLTLACDHPDGFSTADLGLVFECSQIVSRLFEVFSLRDNAQALLETYVGKRTGARVLGGEIRRGDGDEIDAAIMLCDLRGSTRIEETLGRAAYIDLLNAFFETVSTLVHDAGGEVLKFIGDAVLAVFPAEPDAGAACQGALTAAHGIIDTLANDDTRDTPLTCSIGLAFGRVMYGNVGSRERLDFTVIGQAANIAARLGDHGKSAGHAIVTTEEFCATDHDLEPLGALCLHNVSRPVEAFAAKSATMSAQKG
jgi:adenylate cyclase